MNKKKIKKIALGVSHSIILTESGVLYSFGNNEYLQLGVNNSNIKIEEPLIVTDLLNYRILDISSGDNHNVALGLNRNNSYSNELESYNNDANFDKQIIFVWGSNEYNQCGQLKKEKFTSPVKLDLANIAVLNIAEVHLPFKIINYSKIKSVKCFKNVSSLNFGDLIYFTGQLPKYFQSASHQLILSIKDYQFDDF